VTFAEGDLLAPLPAGMALDGVVANLPYVRDDAWATLSSEVRREPRGALLGGGDGLEAIRRLLPQALARLRPGGGLWLEVGHDQGRVVADDLRRTGFVAVAVHPDSAGIERFVRGTRGTPS
jgi:release factor glutamine methyltransferase